MEITGTLIKILPETRGESQRGPWVRGGFVIQIGQFNNTRLTLGAFLHAFTKRGNPKALTFHTDRGSNYTSFCFTRRLHQLQVKHSFSKAHNPYDNSVCEAFFKSIKSEELYRRRYRSVREFRNSVAAYIAEYNAQRPHAANNYLTPDEKEIRWLASKTDEAVRFCPENQGINSETETPAQNSNAENSASNP